MPANLNFLSPDKVQSLATVHKGLAVLDDFCARNIPGARTKASDDLTKAILRTNLALAKPDDRINGFLGHIRGHTQEAVIAAQLETSGETIAAFGKAIPNSEVDVVSSTPDGQAVYNQIKSGRLGNIPDLSQGKGPEFVTQFDRTVTAAITDGVPNVRLIGPELSPQVQQHVADLQAAISATDTALRAGGPAPPKPAIMSPELFAALQAKAATGNPLNLNLSCLKLG